MIGTSTSNSSMPADRPTLEEISGKVRLQVPATSANLGPGYDSLGLALAHYDELEIRRVEQGLSFELSGEGHNQVSRDQSHLVVKAMAQTWASLGITELPGLHIKAVNKIPHSRGLGSSAAAIVAGVCAANYLLTEPLRLSDRAVLQLCSSMEGHPDNVAPALMGNFVISYLQEDGWQAVPVPVHPELKALVAIPDYQVPTKAGRALLPEQVPHRDAASNSGRAALLTHALSTNPDYLFAGTADLLHQQYRASVMQPSAALLDQLRQCGFAALISGAGPSVLVFVRGNDEQDHVKDSLKSVLNHPEIANFSGRRLNWCVLPVDIASKGVMIAREESEIS